jgi:hypothetical protein
MLGGVLKFFIGAREVTGAKALAGDATTTVSPALAVIDAAILRA